MSQNIKEEIAALCALAHECARRGWVPGTAGNFSVRDTESGAIFISRSGLDKGQMTPTDLLMLNAEGRVLEGEGKPSAEAGLHVVLYQRRPQARAIAHVHTICNTLLSARCAAAGQVDIEGYELLKGLAGVETHQHCERVPVIANSQNYGVVAEELRAALDEHSTAHGVLLSGHGLYTWGTSVAETRRHLEALEFLFEVECRRRMGGW
ncbi:MAG TPA: methylthioribulose 1-phosphate dehydratase [Terracidiphilus sp.]|jgi:methylthioribulose-1-phosphate dehydratase|nr:methylthioribulose 1-phosphate dehydratase [Terracidiphilus sp.]